MAAPKLKNPDAALEALRMKDWAAIRLKQLPAHFRSSRPLTRTIGDAGDGELDCGADGETDLDKHRFPNLLKLLSSMSDADRRAVFENLFPKLASTLDTAWKLLPSRTLMQSGEDFCERPFRAPSSQDRLRRERVRFFEKTCHLLRGLDPDPAWLAAWICHLGDYDATLSTILAAALNTRGPQSDEVLSILMDSIRGEHPIGESSDAAFVALLSCDRPDAWDFVIKVLLAAKRDEGTRQSIVEALASAHPDAFRRVLKVIVDENLVRFSSVVRTADVWFNLRWDSAAAKLINDHLVKVHQYLESEKALAAGINDKDPVNAYLALWTAALQDIDLVLKHAPTLLRSDKPERRFAAAYLLTADVPEFDPLVAPLLKDPDLRIAALASHYYTHDLLKDVRQRRFDELEAFYLRVSKEKSHKLKPIVWPWTARDFTPTDAAIPLVRAATPETAERLISHLKHFGSNERATIAAYLGMIDKYHNWEADITISRPKNYKLSETARRTLISLLGDSAQSVRSNAFDGLKGTPVQPDEAETLESLLTRRASDLRASCLTRLASQPDEQALASAQRLLAAKAADLRRAGVELLKLLSDAKRAATQVAALASQALTLPKLDDQTRETLAALTIADAPRHTLEDCLGLLDRSKLTPPYTPRDLGFPSITPEAVALLISLDELIEQHKDTVITTSKKWADDSTEQVALGAIRQESLSIYTDSTCTFTQWLNDDALRPQPTGIQLQDLWTSWFQALAAPLRTPRNLLLAKLILGCLTDDWQTSWRVHPGFAHLWPKDRHHRCLRYGPVGTHVIDWLIGQNTDPAARCEIFLDGAETAFARGRVYDLSRYDRALVLSSPEFDFPYQWWIRQLPYDWHRQSKDATIRLWRLGTAAEHWLANDWWPKHIEKAKKESDIRPPVGMHPDVLAGAFDAGLATEMDIIYDALYTYPGAEWSSALWQPSRRLRRDPSKHTPLDRVYRSIIDRVVEVELARGDAPTAATKPTSNLRFSGGADVALNALARMGKSHLVRNYRNDDDKAKSFSNLIRCSMPLPDDTHDTFKAKAQSLNLSDDRLIELAIYAPQWVSHVETALAWPGLASAVWWIHAHTKSSEWALLSEDRKERDAHIGEYTPIAPDELKDGAVDVAWFQSAYEELGKKRWDSLHDAAKYACGGAGHKRAQLFADAMLSAVSLKELTTRITTKRHQDSIRALGLLPLKGKAADAQVLSRYKIMQEIRRTSCKHGGSMLQASEKRAVEIGMENLARTAGFPDPLRLQWAMETQDVADLAKGPITVKADKVTVTLAIDDDGAPELSATKEGKPLASIPAALRKDKRIAPLAERVKHLRQQGSRMRKSLEAAMCKGDAFRASELADLFQHPVLRPMLERLLFVGDKLLGYPDKKGKVLRSFDGSLEPLRASDQLRIAHPHDLLKSGKWQRFQRECFDAERVQPFKQIFRELYTTTPREQGDEVRATRYAGHQVQPRQAMALLGQREWINRPDEGVQRTFHAERITAWVEFDQSFYTPAEVEGLTLEAVRFNKAGSHEPIPLSKVPPRLFSEVMRDMDLVVSVAHRSGIDPEATESTIEARASLIRETCRLLKLTNVDVKLPRATIKGERADYSLHLGSATIQLLPGGDIWIVPVHAQHRGRLFLPFADNDPKTAEVLSKLILLARDSEIQDPAILAQIRAAR